MHGLCAFKTNSAGIIKPSFYKARWLSFVTCFPLPLLSAIDWSVLWWLLKRTWQIKHFCWELPPPHNVCKKTRRDVKKHVVFGFHNSPAISVRNNCKLVPKKVTFRACLCLFHLPGKNLPFSSAILFFLDIRKRKSGKLHFLLPYF